MLRFTSLLFFISLKRAASISFVLDSALWLDLVARISVSRASRMSSFASAGSSLSGGSNSFSPVPRISSSGPVGPFC